jgi:hypothetical protein
LFFVGIAARLEAEAVGDDEHREAERRRRGSACAAARPRRERVDRRRERDAHRREHEHEDVRDDVEERDDVELPALFIRSELARRSEPTDLAPLGCAEFLVGRCHELPQ